MFFFFVIIEVSFHLLIEGNLKHETVQSRSRRHWCRWHRNDQSTPSAQLPCKRNPRPRHPRTR